MNTRLVNAMVAAIGLAAAPSLLAQGCCEGGAIKEGCSMGGASGHAGHGATAAAGGHEGHGTTQTAAFPQASAPRKVFQPPVQSVFDSYINAQGALAQDSIEGLATTAGAMAKSIRGDSAKALSAKVAQQADALAQAKDLDAARAAFKPLSESLIAYLETQKVPAGSYYVAYCPMAKASWLQTDKTIMNPYMGKSMIHCGQIKS